ncbi:nucleotidyltransferase [Geomonas sp. Red276]
MAAVPEVKKREQVAGVLEAVCRGLELTETQYQLAKDRYETIGVWLAEAENIFLRSCKIYPQGSMSLGTSVRPIGRSEYDVDLICHVPHLSLNSSPDYLKRLVGDRLTENGRYSIEEKGRCWRINYANEFHLDITPSIRNPNCTNGGECVPDKTLLEWKPSNPKGYQAWFEERAELQPEFVAQKAMLFENAEMRAAVEPFPFNEPIKGYLKRCIQLCKHHRDKHFIADPTIAPISVIITTLAAKSYQYIVAHKVYENDLDVLLDVIRYMPFFIEQQKSFGKKHYYIWNETTAGENFAEKWNENEALANAFYEWQATALKQLELLPFEDGMDSLQKALNLSFSESIVASACSKFTSSISKARDVGVLSVMPGVGLTASSSGIKVPKNTFFGE